MKALWDLIVSCLDQFKKNMDSKWVETNPMDLEDDVKKMMKTLKEMKVDKRCNAYLGIMDEIKRWLVFLPLISELRDPAMRDRHW